jgi:hypothetical protein
VQPSNAVGKFFPFTIVYLAQAVLELMSILPLAGGVAS